MKKGYIVVNLLFILAIISVVLVVSSKVIYNNELQNNLDTEIKNKYIDEDFELRLSKINYYIHNNKCDLEKLINCNGRLSIENNDLTLSYDKDNKNFEVVYFDKNNFRYDFRANYEKDEEGNIYLIPEKKYAISAR